MLIIEARTKGEYQMEIIDLTKEISKGMDVYPGDPDVEITQWSTIEKDGYSVHKICFGSHTGTHVDAPAHMVPSGKTIDEMNLRKIMGHVIKLRVLHKHVKLDDVAYKIDAIKKECILLFDIPKNGFLDITVARYIIKNQKIKAVGFIDGAAIDNPNDKAFPVHKIFLEAEVPIITNLVNLENVTDGDFLIALPLKIGGSDGAPCRAVVIKKTFSSI